jgi:hypothetical protein
MKWMARRLPRFARASHQHVNCYCYGKWRDRVRGRLKSTRSTRFLPVEEDLLTIPPSFHRLLVTRAVGEAELRGKSPGHRFDSLSLMSRRLVSHSLVSLPHRDRPPPPPETCAAMYLHPAVRAGWLPHSTEWSAICAGTFCDDVRGPHEHLI